MAITTIHNHLQEAYNQINQIVTHDPTAAIIYTVALGIIFASSSLSFFTSLCFVGSLAFSLSMINNHRIVWDAVANIFHPHQDGTQTVGTPTI